MTRFEVFHPDFVLFAFVVDVTVSCCFWLLLILEESIMQDLVIDIDFTHLRLHSFSHLLLKCLGFVSLRRFLSQLADACLLDEIGKLKWNLVDASLVL